MSASKESSTKTSTNSDDVKTDEKSEKANVQTDEKSVKANVQTDEKSEKANVKTDEKSVKANVKTDEKSEKANVKTDEKSEKANVKTDEKSVKANVKTDEKSEKANVKTDEKSDKANVKTDEKSENANVKTDEKSEKANVKTDEKSEKANVETDEKSENGNANNKNEGDIDVVNNMKKTEGEKETKAEDGENGKVGNVVGKQKKRKKAKTKAEDEELDALVRDIEASGGGDDVCSSSGKSGLNPKNARKGCKMETSDVDKKTDCKGSDGKEVITTTKRKKAKTKAEDEELDALVRNIEANGGGDDVSNEKPGLNPKNAREGCKMVTRDTDKKTDCKDGDGKKTITTTKRKKAKTKEEEELDALVRNIEARDDKKTDCKGGADGKEAITTTTKRKKAKTKEEEELDALVRNIEGRDDKKTDCKGGADGKEAITTTTKRKKKNKKNDDKNNNNNNNAVANDDDDVAKKDGEVEGRKDRNIDGQKNDEEDKIVDDNGDDDKQKNTEAKASKAVDDDPENRTASHGKKPKTKKNNAQASSTAESKEEATIQDKDGDCVMLSDNDDKEKEIAKKKKKKAAAKHPKNNPSSELSTEENRRTKSGDDEIKPCASAPATSESQKRRRRRRVPKTDQEDVQEKVDEGSSSVDDLRRDGENIIVRGLTGVRLCPVTGQTIPDKSLKNNNDLEKSKTKTDKTGTRNKDQLKKHPKKSQNHDDAKENDDLQGKNIADSSQNQDNIVGNNSRGTNVASTPERHVDRLEMMFSRLSPQQNIMTSIRSDGNMKTGEPEMTKAVRTPGTKKPRSVDNKSNQPKPVGEEGGAGIASVNTMPGVQSGGSTINRDATQSQSQGAMASCMYESGHKVRGGDKKSKASLGGASNVVSSTTCKNPKFPPANKDYINKKNPNWEKLSKVQKYNWDLIDDTDWAFIYLDTSSEEGSSGEWLSFSDDDEEEEEDGVEVKEQGSERRQEGHDSFHVACTCSDERANGREALCLYCRAIRLPMLCPQQPVLPNFDSFLARAPGYERSLYNRAEIPERSMRTQIPRTESSQNNPLETDFPGLAQHPNPVLNIPPRRVQDINIPEPVGHVGFHPIYALNNPHFVNGQEERIGTDNEDPTAAVENPILPLKDEEVEKDVKKDISEHDKGKENGSEDEEVEKKDTSENISEKGEENGSKDEKDVKDKSEHSVSEKGQESGSKDEDVEKDVKKDKLEHSVSEKGKENGSKDEKVEKDVKKDKTEHSVSEKGEENGSKDEKDEKDVKKDNSKHSVSEQGKENGSKDEEVEKDVKKDKTEHSVSEKGEENGSKDEEAEKDVKKDKSKHSVSEQGEENGSKDEDVEKDVKKDKSKHSVSEQGEENGSKDKEVEKDVKKDKSKHSVSEQGEENGSKDEKDEKDVKKDKSKHSVSEQGEENGSKDKEVEKDVKKDKSKHSVSEQGEENGSKDEKDEKDVKKDNSKHSVSEQGEENGSKDEKDEKDVKKDNSKHSVSEQGKENGSKDEEVEKDVKKDKTEHSVSEKGEENGSKDEEVEKDVKKDKSKHSVSEKGEENGSKDEEDEKDVKKDKSKHSVSEQGKENGSKDKEVEKDVKKDKPEYSVSEKGKENGSMDGEDEKDVKKDKTEHSVSEKGKENGSNDEEVEKDVKKDKSEHSVSEKGEENGSKDEKDVKQETSEHISEKGEENGSKDEKGVEQDTSEHISEKSRQNDSYDEKMESIMNTEHTKKSNIECVGKENQVALETGEENDAEDEKVGKSKENKHDDDGHENESSIGEVKQDDLEQIVSETGEENQSDNDENEENNLHDTHENEKSIGGDEKDAASQKETTETEVVKSEESDCNETQESLRDEKKENLTGKVKAKTLTCSTADDDFDVEQDTSKHNASEKSRQNDSNDEKMESILNTEHTKEANIECVGKEKQDALDTGEEKQSMDVDQKAMNVVLEDTTVSDVSSILNREEKSVHCDDAENVPSSVFEVSGDSKEEQCMDDSLNSTLSAEETKIAEANYQLLLAQSEILDEEEKLTKEDIIFENGQQKQVEETDKETPIVEAVIGNDENECKPVYVGEKSEENESCEVVQNDEIESKTESGTNQKSTTDDYDAKRDDHIRSQTETDLKNELGNFDNTGTENKENENGEILDKKGLENKLNKQHSSDCSKGGDDGGNGEQCKCFADSTNTILTAGFNSSYPKSIEKILEGIDTFHEEQARLAKQKLDKVWADAFQDFEKKSVEVPIESDDDDTKQIVPSSNTSDETQRGNNSGRTHSSTSENNTTSVKSKIDSYERKIKAIVNVDGSCSKDASDSTSDAQTTKQPTSSLEPPKEMMKPTGLPSLPTTHKQSGDSSSNLKLEEMELINPDDLPICHEIVILSEDGDPTQSSQPWLATPSNEKVVETRDILNHKRSTGAKDKKRNEVNAERSTGAKDKKRNEVNAEQSTGAKDKKRNEVKKEKGKGATALPLSEVKRRERDLQSFRRRREDEMEMRRQFRERAMLTLEQEAKVAGEDVDVTITRDGSNSMNYVIRMEMDDDEEKGKDEKPKEAKSDVMIKGATSMSALEEQQRRERGRSQLFQFQNNIPKPENESEPNEVTDDEIQGVPTAESLAKQERERDLQHFLRVRENEWNMMKQFRERAMETLEQEAKSAGEDIDVSFKRGGDVMDYDIRMEPDYDDAGEDAAAAESKNTNNHGQGKANESPSQNVQNPEDNKPEHDDDSAIFKKPKNKPRIPKSERKTLLPTFQPPTVPNEDPKAKEERLRQKTEISNQFRRRMSELQNQRRKSCKKEKREKLSKTPSETGGEDQNDESVDKGKLAVQLRQRIAELTSKSDMNDKEIRHIQRVLGRDDFPRDESGKVIPHCLQCARTERKLRVCVRCEVARYCSRECQVGNHPLHKERCKRLNQWQQVQARIPPMIDDVMAIYLMTFVRRLKMIPEPYQELGPRALLAKIVSMYYFHDVLSANVEDMGGDVAMVNFITPFKDYYPPGPAPPRGKTSTTSLPFTCEPVPLIRCLEPNMFVLILNARWIRYPDNRVGLPIYNMRQLFFIDLYCKTKLRNTSLEETEV